MRQRLEKELSKKFNLPLLNHPQKGAKVMKVKMPYFFLPKFQTATIFQRNAKNAKRPFGAAKWRPSATFTTHFASGARNATQS